MKSANGVLSRQKPRSMVSLKGTLKYMGRALECRIIDLSDKGIGLQLLERPDVGITANIPVTFNSPELGHLTGSVVWVRPDGTVGLRLNHTTSTYAQVSAYFRFFHRDYVPAIKDWRSGAKARPARQP